MITRNFAVLAGALAILFLFVGIAQAGAGAMAHLKHVTESWSDTPGKMGLAPTMAAEAEIAEKHAGFAASKPDDLEWVQKHMRHVRHAIDTSTETSGPGKGYGVIKAARGVAKHINLGAASDDASASLKTHAKHISQSAENVVAWSNRIILLSDNILEVKPEDTKDMKSVAKWVKAVHEATQHILSGFDENGDGKISWDYGEGGVAQVNQHLGFIK